MMLCPPGAWRPQKTTPIAPPDAGASAPAGSRDSRGDPYVLGNQLRSVFSSEALGAVVRSPSTMRTPSLSASGSGATYARRSSWRSLKLERSMKTGDATSDAMSRRSPKDPIRRMGFSRVFSPSGVPRPHHTCHHNNKPQASRPVGLPTHNPRQLAEARVPEPGECWAAHSAGSLLPSPRWRAPSKQMPRAGREVTTSSGSSIAYGRRVRAATGRGARACRPPLQVVVKVTKREGEEGAEGSALWPNGACNDRLCRIRVPHTGELPVNDGAETLALLLQTGEGTRRGGRN